MAGQETCFIAHKNWLNDGGHAIFISICLVAIVFQGIPIFVSLKDTKVRVKLATKFFILHFIGNTVVLVNYIWSSSTFIITGAHTCVELKCWFLFHQNAGCIAVISLVIITQNHHQELLKLGTLQTKNDVVKNRRKTFATALVTTVISLVLTASAICFNSNRLIGLNMLYEACLIITCTWYCYRSSKVPWHGAVTSFKTQREVNMLKTNETIILLSIVLTTCPRMLNIGGNWTANKIHNNAKLRTFILCVAKMYILGLLLKPVVFIAVKTGNWRHWMSWRCLSSNKVTSIIPNSGPDT